MNKSKVIKWIMGHWQNYKTSLKMMKMLSFMPIKKYDNQKLHE
jgi:hypothetical protein